MSDENETNPKRRRRKRRSRRNPMSKFAKVALGTGAVVSTGAIVWGIYNKITAKDRKLACGEKYKYLIVTASGYTLEDPGSDLPFAGNSMYSEWYDLAHDLAKQAYRRFAELGQIECEATGGANCDTEDASGGHYPRWDALVSINNRMTQKLDDLPGPFFAGPSYGLSRSQAQSVIKDAVCLMEQADDGILHYGGNVPTTPSFGGAEPGRPMWEWIAFAGGTALAIGGIAYGLSRSGSSAASERPQIARASRPE
jgi:hypothetical protein